MKKRRKAFTLVEVLAALGLIIVLTLMLVATVQLQVKRANEQNLVATVAAVNTQLMLEYNGNTRNWSNLGSLEALVNADIITAEQARQMAGKVSYNAGGNPPTITVNR